MSTAKFDDPFFSLPGVLYFVQAGGHCDECRSIKIGVANRSGFLRRLRGIQSANHTRIRLLQIIRCDTMREAEELELKLHRKFAQGARAPHGSVGYEWFAATPALIQEIAALGPLDDALSGLPNGPTITALFVQGAV